VTNAGADVCVPDENIGRVDVSEPASISSGIAERYASAMFDLAKDSGKLDALGTDIDALETALSDSAEFRTLVHSPLHSRSIQQQAVSALAEKMELSRITANTLALMASKRRLFVLPYLLRELREMIAEARGEVTADVTAATALSAAQAERLAETLKAKVGKDVKVRTTVDESLIGGLVVKVGSRMIDTSIAARLAALQNAMKEVG